MNNQATPRLRDLAERLLVHNTRVETRAPSDGLSAAFAICEKLRGPLTTLAGGAGFQSLLMRALTLATRQVPVLAFVRARPGGSLEIIQPDQITLANDREAGIALVAQLLGLLFTLIGEPLTLRLFQQVWPEVSFDSFTNEGTDHGPQQ